MSLDLNLLKETLQNVFDAANTTTATRDLSTGLTTRVQRVVKLNPSLIPIQADWYPYVSIWIDSKDVEPADFAATQLAAKRKATVRLKVAGGVWETGVAVGAEGVDEADEDCESLMENIEEVLRGNPTVNGLVTWHFPVRTKYYNAPLEEGSCLRVGVLDLDATVFY